MMKIERAVAIAALLAVVNCANNVTDKVAAMPDCAPLPSAWFSGYLDVTATK